MEDLPVASEDLLKQYKDNFSKEEQAEISGEETVFYLGKKGEGDVDDQEGYYNVHIDDHLSYRYQILSVLGKGSFA